MATPLSSRGLRGYGGGILAGCLSVLFFCVGFGQVDTIFLLIAYLAAVPLFIAGLGAGTIPGIIASVTGVAALIFLRPVDFVLLYIVTFGLPASVLTALALRHDSKTPGTTAWYSEGNLFTAILIYPCIAFLAACAAAYNHGGLLAQTEAGMISAIGQLKNELKDQLDADTMKQFLYAMNHLARMLPSMLGIFWILVISISGIVAQIVLKQAGWNLRPSLDTKQVFLPKWILFCALLSAGAIAYGKAPFDYIGLNLSILFALAYIIVGLVIVHAYADKFRWGTWGLFIFYILIMLKWTMLPLIAATLFLGISDQWIDFRRRFAGIKQGG